MLIAAFTSAWPQYPQDLHRKTAWLSRALPWPCGSTPAEHGTAHGPGEHTGGWGGEHAAVRLWTALRTRQCPGRYPRPHRYPGRAPGAGSQRTRHATGPRGRGSPAVTSHPRARDETSGTAPTPLSVSAPAPSAGSAAGHHRGRGGRCGIPHPAQPCATTADDGCPRRSSSWPGRGRGSPAVARSHCPQPATGPLRGLRSAGGTGPQILACAVRDATMTAAQHIGSTRTGHGHNAPAGSPPARVPGSAGTWTWD